MCIWRRQPHALRSVRNGGGECEGGIVDGNRSVRGMIVVVVVVQVAAAISSARGEGSEQCEVGGRCGCGAARRGHLEAHGDAMVAIRLVASTVARTVTDAAGRRHSRHPTAPKARRTSVAWETRPTPGNAAGHVASPTGSPRTGPGRARRTDTLSLRCNSRVLGKL